MTYEEFLQIPIFFLKSPKQINERIEEINKNFTEQEQEFMNHYQRFYNEKLEIIILGHLKDSLDHEGTLNNMKNILERDYQKS